LLTNRIARALLSARKRQLFAKFQTADVIVSKGGHIFVSDGSLSGLLGLYLYLFPLMLGIRLGRRVVVYGQSIGPVPDRLGRALLGAVLQRCYATLAREELSYDFVRSLGVESSRLKLCWDTAFAVERMPLPSQVEAQLPAAFAVMTVRQWEFPGLPTEAVRDRYLAYLQAMATTIDRLWTRHRLPVVLAPQVIGPSTLENDYFAWDDLLPLVENRDSTVCVRADLSPSELMELYGRARILLGTRFHSVILGLAAGTPSAAVAYYGFKTRGIMRMLGLEALVFDIGSLANDDVEQALEDLIGQEAEYRSFLAMRMPTILTDCAQTARFVLDEPVDG
jgi:polysaccharide pyruvyl transferase WcaK-like protein